MFFNDTATTEIYTLSLHDALPIFALARRIIAALTGAHDQRRPRLLPLPPARRPPRTRSDGRPHGANRCAEAPAVSNEDRKSTRLNSSHANISYAVFCLKKKITPQ